MNEELKQTSQSPQKRLLFLCTGNYYRSRFAEILFNSTARQKGLPWEADSRGLALERGINNVGPIAMSVAQALERMKILADGAVSRFPVTVTTADFEQADSIVALQRAEHLPLLQARFPAWAEKVEYWHVEDAPEALSLIEGEVARLVASLLCTIT